MTILEIILLLVIAAVCGAVAQAIVRVSLGGFLASVGFGFIGALLGTWLAHAASLPELFVIHLAGVSFPIVWAILGSVIFVAIVALITRRRLVVQS
jgi:uncharacterized membrane protein YeaQ/YmgE (transglycosylase-associated protein family)